MKPRPFVPKEINAGSPFFRDETTGQVWHRCAHRILYADTDRSEVVYHANYLRYYELGRSSLMRDVGYPYKEIEHSGYVYPIINLGIDFFRSLYYDDPVFIHTRPAELARVKLSFDYAITHAETGDLICRGFTRHCALNLAGRPVAVDGKTVQIWKTFPQ
ncbi:MAG TPA: thioesterase family protein [Spirochaetota bacterium]|nr:thioesterase family protein [Spirochaetota bacterium]HPI87712.1 thioesterase family protein [Spirochaetota bacterium]HPR48163.1 thioesterase family protein [Spirochaetota bacterium]